MIVLTKWVSKLTHSAWSIQIGDNVSKQVVEIFEMDDGEIHTERFGAKVWSQTRYWITVGEEEKYEIRESSWLELLILTGITKREGLAMLKRGVGLSEKG